VVLIAPFRVSMYYESMSDERAEETAEELISSIDGQIDKKRLARWHRWDLIPAPTKREFLGRGKGSRTLYPPGTKAQLLRLMTFLKSDRRASHARWSLWWEGFQIPLNWIRALLAEVAEKFDKFMPMLVNARGLSERAWQFIDEAPEARLGNPILRRARKRIGKERFPTLVRIIMEIATGTFKGWSPPSLTGAKDASESEILEKATGLDRARVDRMGKTGPWLTGDLGPELKQLSKSFSSVSMINVLADTTDEELIEARNELRNILSTLERASVMAEGLLGRGALGLGRVREIANLPPVGQSSFLLLWLVLRRERAIIEGLNVIVKQAHTWLPHVASAEALAQLRAEVPGIAELMSYRRIKSALNDGAAMEKLTTEISEFANAHRPAVQAFFNRHPEYREIGKAPEPPV